MKSLKYNKERILKPTVDSSGYLIVSLYKNTKAKTKNVHQLVAESFLNHVPCGNRSVVDHINNVKTDNGLGNLQIITHRENLSKDKKGSSEYTGVSWCCTGEKWRADIRINGKTKYLGRFTDELKASEAYQKALIIELIK